ncbi:MAG: ferrous iron transport protein B [Anaerolineales bacterium]
MRPEPDLRIALVGNPNSGKTTLFNALTGAHQHVGNWPGKTVERKQGWMKLNGRMFSVLDLPGTYSLTAYSEEECIARDALLDAPPDLVLVVLDACNLERHLYLGLQVLEMGLPTILALNMSDLAEKEGGSIDCQALAAHLGGVPVVSIAARFGTGLPDLKTAIERSARLITEQRPHGGSAFKLDYGDPVEKELAWLSARAQKVDSLQDRFDPRWLALKLLEGEYGVECRVADCRNGENLLRHAAEARRRLQQIHASESQLLIADRRYKLASVALQGVLQKSSESRAGMDELLDRAVTHPLFGVLLFLFVMYLVFSLVVEVSAPFLDWISSFFGGPLTRWASWGMAQMGAPEWLRGLLVEGVIDGVGGVLVFLPGLVVLFAFIAVLEDSGYLARAAFVMNRALSWMGLTGKSFVPLVLGFGCAVPAVYATRTLERRRDRILTALLIPFMSCSARLPVYVVFALAFFGTHASLVIWGLYAAGVLFAAGAGWVLSRTMLRSEESASFILELPPYRWPGVRDTARVVRRRTGAFVRNAGTVILGASVAIWLLLNLPAGAHDLENTYFGGLSKALAPVFAPAGFGTWQASGSLVSGLVAKEVVVATMSQIYLGEEQTQVIPEQLNLGDDLLQTGRELAQATASAAQRLGRTLSLGLLRGPVEETQGSTSLGRILPEKFTRPAALAFLVYVLLYVPCIATLSALRAEFGVRWALFSAAYQSLTAWIAAVGVYQLARLLL